MRRVAAVVVACTGVGLIVAVFVFHGFQHAYDGEHIMGQVRPALTANGTIFRHDLVVYDRGTSQLFGSMLPALEADANTGGGAIDYRLNKRIRLTGATSPPRTRFLRSQCR